MWLLVPVLLGLHILVCALLVLAVLMQLPRSEGLGAAFGGGVTSELWGGQATTVLAKSTVWLGVAFFVVTLLLAMAYSRVGHGNTKEQDKLMSAPLPAAAASPLPSASPAAALPEASPVAVPVASPALSPVPAQP